MSQKIFYGWWIVFATSLIHFWGAGTFFYGFTAFFNPIVYEFGWSYSATSLAASIRSIEGGFAAPLVGLAADRFGPRKLMFLGSITSGLGFILFSQIETLMGFYLVFLFLSISASFLFPIPGWTAVAGWFDKKRGIAIGILSAAIGAGGILIFAINISIEIFDWRTTLVFIGLGMWLIGIPCSLIVRHRPESYGLTMDGEPLTTYTTKRNPIFGSFTNIKQEYRLGQALRTPAYWGIACATTISAANVHAVVVHVMPHLINQHFTRNIASLAAALIVMSSILGRFGMGWSSNRIDSRKLLAISLVLQAIGLLFLAGARNTWMVLAFIGTLGPGYGGVITLRLILQAQYFGHKAFGAIQGSLMAVMMLGTISSPLLTGYCFDHYGNYQLAWIIMATLNVVIMPVIMMIPPLYKP